MSKVRSTCARPGRAGPCLRPRRRTAARMGGQVMRSELRLGFGEAADALDADLPAGQDLALEVAGDGLGFTVVECARDAYGNSHRFVAQTRGRTTPMPRDGPRGESRGHRRTRH